MIPRAILSTLQSALDDGPATIILGPRQVGKTTLARAVANEIPSLYIDLESPSDQALLQEPETFFNEHRETLIILDEVQRFPDLFSRLRGVIDRGRAEGLRKRQFLLLGSASHELLRQSSESLAGRASYLELAPLDAREVEDDALDVLWLRGGFPESYLADTGAQSLRWRNNFVTTYLERDIPQFGLRISSTLLRRLWTMLAHHQGSIHNASIYARSLAVDVKTVTSYIDILCDLMLVRRLSAFHRNIGKRLVRSPKIYLRDSGILHALLNIPSYDALLAHPIIGTGWEGFCLETLLAAVPQGTEAFFYRTHAGAEIDLLLELPGGRLIAIEFKRSSTPKLERGFFEACETLQPHETFVVYPGVRRFPLSGGTVAIGLRELASKFSSR